MDYSSLSLLKFMQQDWNSGVNKDMMNNGSLPVWSRYHPVIPKRYVPEWTTDMKNRRLIVENCKLSNYKYGPHDRSIYLEHRERLNNVEPKQMVESKTVHIPRERLLNPWFHSPLSKYQSSLMHFNLS